MDAIKYCNKSFFVMWIWDASKTQMEYKYILNVECYAFTWYYCFTIEELWYRRKIVYAHGFRIAMKSVQI